MLPEAVGGEPARCAVLVIEDDDMLRELLAEVLDERGFGVRCAANGADGLAMLESYHPDAVVLDLLMPVMHGWAFMEEYERKTNGQPIPIVVVSVNPLLPRSYDRFGVHRCVGKPFELDELVEAVEHACGRVAA